MAVPALAATDVEWLNPASGSWQTGSNWSGNTTPQNGVPAGTEYRVTIDATGSPYAVGFSAGAVTVDSILLDSANATLALTGGTLTSQLSLGVKQGTLRMEGGTIKNTTIAGSGGVVDLYQGVLDHVTLSRDAFAANNLPNPPSNIRLTIRNGLVLDNATFTLSQVDQYLVTSGMRLEGTQTISGTGKLSFSGDRRPTVSVASGTLTLASGVTIDGAAGIYFGGSDIDNYGTVRATRSDWQMLIARGTVNDVFTNYGLLEATGTAGLVIEARLDNTNGIIRANGGYVVIGDGSVGAPGVSTSKLGTLQAINGGSITIGGVVDNSNFTLTSNAATGNIGLAGIFTGGTLATADGTEYFVGHGAEMIGLTLAGALRVSTQVQMSGATLNPNSLTLNNATITLQGVNLGYGPNAWITSNSDQTLSGTGLILFEGGHDKNGLRGRNGTLTLAPGITVRTGTGGGELWENITNYGLISAQTAGRTITSSNGTLTNHGVIQVLNGGSFQMQEGWLTNKGLLSISGTGSRANLAYAWNNSGTISSSAGATVSLGGTWANTGALNFADSTVTTSGTWSSSGHISSANSTLNLGGTFTVPTSFTRTGGVVKILGTLTNSPLSLSLTAATGSWELHTGGRIVGGTISTAGGAQLIGRGGTIDSADLLGRVDVPASQAITLTRSTIHGVLTSGAGSATALTDTVNAGNVTITGATLAAGGAWDSSGSITGLASATLNLSGTWSNGGVIAITDSTATFSGNWTSPGSIVLTNSTLNLAGTFAAPFSMTRTGGSVRITGTLSDSTLNLNAGTGSWDLVAGGRVLGGTITSADGAKLLGKGGTIESTTVLGEIDVPALQTLSVHKSTLHGTLSISGGANLSTTTIHGSAAVTSGAAMTLGASTINFGSVSSTGGALYLGAMSNGGQVTTSGGTLGFTGEWANAGTIAATGTAVSLGGSTTAVGTVVFADSTVNVVGSYTSDQLQQMTFVNSQINLPGGVTIANAGGVLSLGLQLNGGTINGGTIATSAGSPLVVHSGTIGGTEITGYVNVASGGTLGVTNSTITGTLLTSAGSTTSIGGTWSNAGLVSVSGGTLNLSGEWSNSGTIATTGGSLNIAGNWSNSGTVSTNGSTVSLAAAPSTIGTVNFVDTTVNLTGAHTTANLKLFNYVNSTLSTVTTGNIVNEADTLTATPNMSLRFAGGTLTGGTLSSAGSTPSVANGATTTFNNVTIDTALNVGSISTLNLRGSWHNNGVITAAEYATLSLGGSFTTADIGTLNRTAGSVRIVGNLDNTGSTLNVDNIGTWYLDRGQISGGTINVADGVSLNVSSFASPSTLSGVMLSSGRINVDSSAILIVSNGLTLAAGTSMTVNGGTEVRFVGHQTLGGSGTIVFDGGTNALFRPQGFLTIAPGILIKSGARGATLGITTNRIYNQGTIAAVTARTIAISGVFSNEGTVEASNGGVITLPGTTSLLNYNTDTQTLTGGRWRVFDNSTLRIGPIVGLQSPIVVNDADVLMSGPNSVFAQIDPLASNLGRFALQAGRDFTTVGDLYNDGHISVGAGSDLNVTGDLTMGENGSMEVGVASYDPPVGGAGLRSMLMAADPFDPEGYGQLTVQGTLTLNGTLILSVGGHAFSPGDLFTVLTANQITGQFTSIQFDKGLDGTISYSETGVDFHVTSVPEPAAAGALVLAGAGMLRRRRRATSPRP